MENQPGKTAKAAKAEKSSTAEGNRETYNTPPYLAAKRKELVRVLKEKNFQIANENLTYLDYLELKEEIHRLKNLKDTLYSRNN